MSSPPKYELLIADGWYLQVTSNTDDKSISFVMTHTDSANQSKATYSLGYLPSGITLDIKEMMNVALGFREETT